MSLSQPFNFNSEISFMACNRFEAPRHSTKAMARHFAPVSAHTPNFSLEKKGSE